MGLNAESTKAGYRPAKNEPISRAIPTRPAARAMPAPSIRAVAKVLPVNISSSGVPAATSPTAATLRSSDSSMNCRINWPRSEPSTLRIPISRARSSERAVEG